MLNVNYSREDRQVSWLDRYYWTPRHDQTWIQSQSVSLFTSTSASFPAVTLYLSLLFNTNHRSGQAINQHGHRRKICSELLGWHFCGTFDGCRTCSSLLIPRSRATANHRVWLHLRAVVGFPACVTRPGAREQRTGSPRVSTVRLHKNKARDRS